MPERLFTFAAYLGAVPGLGPNGVSAASVALFVIFLPGFLILIGVLPFWNRFRYWARAQSSMQGANAAVVGILGTAFYCSVFTGAIGLMWALACFVPLMTWKMPPSGGVIVAALEGSVWRFCLAF